MMNRQGRETTFAEPTAHVPKTFTGNRGLRIEAGHEREPG